MTRDFTTVGAYNYPIPLQCMNESLEKTRCQAKGEIQSTKLCKGINKWLIYYVIMILNQSKLIRKNKLLFKRFGEKSSLIKGIDMSTKVLTLL